MFHVELLGRTWDDATALVTYPCEDAKCHGRISRTSPTLLWPN